ncbi:MAG TPA: septal ring lytic transglycosylase RlpA family protein [Bryobacteraceae bacterium]|nr:septal ring lytic transglycosylase RlpA family protein [Bryobacteraceae bacterium]
MARHVSILAFAILPLSFLLSSCAHHRHAARTTLPTPPAPAQIPGVETGLASWYGHPYHGRAAANGEIYDMEKLTAAHRTLPFGTWVRVTNLANTKSVDVRIIDRGPFIDGRIIDLSHAAAQAIDMVGPGVVEVRLDILSAPASPASLNWFAAQAGAFADKERAEKLRSSLEREYGSARLVLRPGTPTLWRVLVGREHSEQAAAVLARRVSAEVGPAFVVRLDAPEQQPSNSPAVATSQ